MRTPFPPRYFLASIALLLVLVALYAVWAIRRTQHELTRQLEQKGVALAEAFETSSQNAIQGNALMEEMIAQRLFDNARLIDQLLLTRPFDPALLKRISAMNRLQRVDLLDREGRPYKPPRTRRGMVGPGMRGMMRGAPGSAEMREAHRRMMMYMWGRRWGPRHEEAVPPPPPVEEEKFWEGSLFGVAVEARSFPGIIAVHADADYVLNFRKEIGVEQQIQELGRQPGVEEVALLGSDLTVLAHSDPGRQGERENDSVLQQALEGRKPLSRLVTGTGGTEVFEVLRPLSLGGSRLGLLRVALSTAPVEQEWKRDVRSAAVLGLAVLLAGALGMAVIFYMQHRHLVEVKSLAAEVERRDRLASLGNLAAAVAHEVRNPLNAIAMGLQRLREEFRPANDEADYARFVDLMQGEVQRLNGIVQEFLSLARPLSLNPDAVQIGELLSEVAALVEPDAETRGITVNLDLLSDLPSAQLDRDHIKQVLLNLVLNGLEAMPGGGTLTISAAVTRQALVLTVSDTGGGVPADLLPKIFEPYVTTKAKGMGLGLTIARRIIEAHGGTIAVESRPGEGTRSTLTLPLTLSTFTSERPDDG
ncbi:MAG: ATP-binding protein [Candidatus Methylomirabilales bacterium]